MPDGLPNIDPDIVAGRIGSLLADRRPGAVKPLLAALAKLAPDHQNLALFRSTYWCQVQDIPQALEVLVDAIALQPDNAALWLRQSEIFFAQSRYEDAAQTAAQALLLAPDLGAAKSRLGLALLQLGLYDQALPCLAESFSNDPRNTDVALALAALSAATAIDILQQAIAANPKAAVLQNALARRYLCNADTRQAAQTARHAVGNGIADAQTHCLLAFAQMHSADWQAAMISITQAQSIAPESPWAARLLAALSSRQSGRLPPAMPQDAAIAEQALIAGGVIAPGAFRALIGASELTGPVLDICCGTGLNGIAAQGLGLGAWTGIEPSPVLLARCAERAIYTKLLQSDPLQPPLFFHDPSTEYPIILLNEALARLQSPRPFLAAIHTQLAAGGIALAAIPTGGTGGTGLSGFGGTGLGGHGLFTHRELDLAQAAAGAGLSFEVSRTGILRHLEGLPVHGVIAIFRSL